MQKVWETYFYRSHYESKIKRHQGTQEEMMKNWAIDPKHDLKYVAMNETKFWDTQTFNWTIIGTSITNSQMYFKRTAVNE